MRTDLGKPIDLGVGREGATVWVILILLVVGLLWATWSVYALFGAGESQSVPFVVAEGWFVILALGYLGLHGLRGAGWTSVPVLLTIKAIIAFALIPIWQFDVGEDILDAGAAHAMYLVLIGFIAFWIGSLLFSRRAKLQFMPRNRGTSDRVVIICAAMFVLGLAGNLFLWRAGLFSYTADRSALNANQGILQWLNAIGGLLTSVLVVSAIEVLGKRSSDRHIRTLFWLSLVFTIGFGVISGMKEAILTPIIYVALIVSIIHKRLPRWVIAVPVVLVVFIYPFMNAFRVNTSAGYRAQANSLGGMSALIVKSFDDAYLSFGSESSGVVNSNAEMARGRINYLDYVRNVIELPAPSMLNGDEKLWLAPIYPLVPRFLWKSKPTFDKGGRLSYLHGLTPTAAGDISSAAVTSIADLNTLHGRYGVALGMLFWGAILQFYMNWTGRKNASEMTLFIYIMMLVPLLNLEADVIGLIGKVVHSLIVSVITAYVIYGRPAPSLGYTRRPVGNGRY